MMAYGLSLRISFNTVSPYVADKNTRTIACFGIYRATVVTNDYFEMGVYTTIVVDSITPLTTAG